MEQRDDQILNHVGRYTISLKKIIETLYFAGGSANNTITRLIRDGLLQRNNQALEGNYAYYQLSKKGCALLGLAPNKARPKDEKGLAQDLGAVWFSCMGDLSRKRLSNEELKTLFGAPKGGNVIHVAQAASDDDTAVFRLFIPGEATRSKPFLASVKKAAHDALSDEKLLRWIERGTYRFAILVHDDRKVQELRKGIEQEEFPDLRIHLEIAPTPSTLRQFMSPEKEADQ